MVLAEVNTPRSGSNIEKLQFMDDFDPASLLGDNLQLGGIRKQCTDYRRCGLGLACEHAQTRNEASELVGLWDGNTNACGNFTPRRELQSTGDLPRKKPGHKRHNQLARSNPLIKPPDLMVKRHIKDGRNIKGDD